MKKEDGTREENVEKEHFSWKRLLITIAIVILTAGVTFAVTWYILDKSTKESDEASNRLRGELQSQVDELRGKLKDTDTDDSLVYSNTDYGFSMTFPESWKGYRVYDKKVDGITATWYVELPTNDNEWNANATATAEKGYASIFAVSAHTAAEWAEDQASVSPSSYLGKKGAYTFGYSGAQAGPKDLMDTFDDVKKIIATFTLK